MKLTVLACMLAVLSLWRGVISPGETLGPAPGSLLVMTAEVTDRAATVWVRGVDDDVPVTLEYSGLGAPEAAAVIALSPAHDLTGHARVEGLRPSTRYEYRVRQGEHVAVGSFLTAPAPDEAAPVRFLWSGDLGGAGHCRRVEDGYRIFPPMTARRPDFFLFVGDTIYADHFCAGPEFVPGNDFVARTADEFRRKHRYNRGDPALQQFFRTASVYAIWDDHEVRNNFAGPHEPLMPAGREAFLDYFPVVSRWENPTQMYRRVRRGRLLELFILDARQYRSANREPDGPDKTMLGGAQLAWLLAGLRTSTAVWKVIVSSVPLGMYTGGPGADAWSDTTFFGAPRRNGTGFTRERDLILGTLRDLAIPDVVFITGDVHHAELIRHQLSPDYAVHELIAGPLSARQGHPRFLERSLRSRSLGGLGWADNFGEFAVGPDRLTVRIIDAAGTVRLTRVFRPAAREPDTTASRVEVGRGGFTGRSHRPPWSGSTVGS